MDALGVIVPLVFLGIGAVLFWMLWKVITGYNQREQMIEQQSQIIDLLQEISAKNGSLTFDEDEEIVGPHRS